MAHSMKRVYGAINIDCTEYFLCVVPGQMKTAQTRQRMLPAEDTDIVAGVGITVPGLRAILFPQRDSHFSSWARRGIISDRLATAILVHAGRTAGFITGEAFVPGDFHGHRDQHAGNGKW